MWATKCGREVYLQTDSYRAQQLQRTKIYIVSNIGDCVLASHLFYSILFIKFLLFYHTGFDI